VSAVVDPCPRCGAVPASSDMWTMPVDAAGRRDASGWRRRHEADAWCARDALAAELYGRDLAAFPLPGPGIPALPGDLPAPEIEMTRAPYGARYWGVAPLPVVEDAPGGQLWYPLWVRVVCDVYEELLLAERPLCWDALAAHRDALLVRMVEEDRGAEDLQRAVEAVFFTARDGCRPTRVSRAASMTAEEHHRPAWELLRASAGVDPW
jgi:hypothetical protein